MVKESNIMEMVIFTEVNSPMDCLKVMDNIFGKIWVRIEGISNKDRGQDMEFGKLMNTDFRITKVTITQTKRQDMEFIHGTTDGPIKEISKTITEMALDNFLILINNYHTEEIGSMEIRSAILNPNLNLSKENKTTILNTANLNLNKINNLLTIWNQLNFQGNFQLNIKINATNQLKD